MTTFTYQFCRYTLVETPRNFAYMDQHFLFDDGTKTDSVRTFLTDDSFRPSFKGAIIEHDNKEADGVSLAHTSNSNCQETLNYSFYTDIICDVNIDADGAGVVTSVMFD